jgi:hypothetical protein
MCELSGLLASGPAGSSSTSTMEWNARRSRTSASLAASARRQDCSRALVCASFRTTFPRVDQKESTRLWLKERLLELSSPLEHEKDGSKDDLHKCDQHPHTQHTSPPRIPPPLHTLRTTRALSAPPRMMPPAHDATSWTLLMPVRQAQLDRGQERGGQVVHPGRRFTRRPRRQPRQRECPDGTERRRGRRERYVHEGVEHCEGVERSFYSLASRAGCDRCSARCC